MVIHIILQKKGVDQKEWCREEFSLQINYEQVITK